MKVTTACSLFLDHCTKEKHLSPHSLAAYEQDLAEFRRYFRARAIDSILGEELVGYSEYLSRNRLLAPATVKRRLACARALCIYLVHCKTLEKSPFEGLMLRIRLPSRLPRSLRLEELRALLHAADQTDTVTQLAVLLLFATGIRVSELCSIRHQDIDLDQRSIRISGKGNRERQVFLPDAEIVTSIRRYLAATKGGLNSEALLRTARGNATTPTYVRAKIRKLGRQAGLARRITPHMLRHTTATALIEAGVDIRLVQRLLGHQSIATTQIYTHVSDQALKTAILRANIYGLARAMEVQ